MQMANETRRGSIVGFGLCLLRVRLPPFRSLNVMADMFSCSGHNWASTDFSSTRVSDTDTTLYVPSDCVVFLRLTYRKDPTCHTQHLYH